MSVSCNAVAQWLRLVWLVYYNVMLSYDEARNSVWCRQVDRQGLSKDAYFMSVELAGSAKRLHKLYTSVYSIYGGKVLQEANNDVVQFQ